MSVARAVEALLVMITDPVLATDLAAQLGISEHGVMAGLEQLTWFYRETGRGLELRRVTRRWRLATAPDLTKVLEATVVMGTRARLNQTALETLVVIAYLQPVTRDRISRMRSVGVDGVVQTLLAYGLITEAGEEPNGAMTFAITSLFLQKLGLNSLNELPGLAPLLPDVVALEAEFRAASEIEEQHDWAGGHPPAEDTGGGQGGVASGQRDPDLRGTC